MTAPPCGTGGQPARSWACWLRACRIHGPPLVPPRLRRRAQWHLHLHAQCPPGGVHPRGPGLPTRRDGGMGVCCGMVRLCWAAAWWQSQVAIAPWPALHGPATHRWMQLLRGGASAAWRSCCLSTHCCCVAALLLLRHCDTAALETAVTSPPSHAAAAPRLAATSSFSARTLRAAPPPCSTPLPRTCWPTATARCASRPPRCPSRHSRPRPPRRGRTSASPPVRGWADVY